jgi:hypothetical protein
MSHSDGHHSPSGTRRTTDASTTEVSTAQGLATTRLGGRIPKDPGRLQASYSTAIGIWIQRFREAQKVIRELEDELEAVTTERDALMVKLGQIESKHTG